MKRIGVVIATLALGACSSQAPQPRTLTPVKVAAVEEQAHAHELRYSGNVEPRDKVVVSFKVGGYVERIVQTGGRDAQEGDRVEKGAVLAVLRQADYQAKLRQARAQAAEAAASLAAVKSQVAEAEFALRQAQTDFKRAQNLFESQSLTRADYDGARTKLDVAQARVETARNQVSAVQSRGAAAEALTAEAELAAGDSELKAPVAGTVLKRMVDPGSLVGPGTPAFVLGDLSAVKVVFGVSDSDVAAFRAGAALRVVSEAVPGEFAGRVTKVAPSADPRSRLFDVELTIPNEGGRMRPGMVVTVIASTAPEKEAPVVPLSAIVRSKGGAGYAVWVLEDSGKGAVARLREVALGEAFGNRIAVTSGIRAGERVITTGSNLVREGEQVQVIP